MPKRPSYMEELAIKRKLDAIEEQFERLMKEYEESIDVGNIRARQNDAFEKWERHAEEVLRHLGVPFREIGEKLKQEAELAGPEAKRIIGADVLYDENFKMGVLKKLIEEKREALERELAADMATIEQHKEETERLRTALEGARNLESQRKADLSRLAKQNMNDKKSLKRHDRVLASRKAQEAIERIQHLQAAMPEVERKFHAHADLVKRLTDANKVAEGLRVQTNTSSGMGLEETLERVQSNIHESSGKMIQHIARKKEMYKSKNYRSLPLSVRYSQTLVELKEINSKKAEYQERVDNQEKHIHRLESMRIHMQHLHERFMGIRGAYSEDYVRGRIQEYEERMANIDKVISDARKVKERYQDVVDFMDIDLIETEKQNALLRGEADDDLAVMRLNSQYEAYKIEKQRLIETNSPEERRKRLKTVELAHSEFNKERRALIRFEAKYVDETGELKIPEPFDDKDDVLQDIDAIRAEHERLRSQLAKARSTLIEKQGGFREWEKQVAAIKESVKRCESMYSEQASVALVDLARLSERGNKGAQELLRLSSEGSMIQAELSTGIDSFRDRLAHDVVNMERYAKAIEEQKDALEREMPGGAIDFQGELMALSRKFSHACKELAEAGEALGVTCPIPRQKEQDFSAVIEEVESLLEAGEPMSVDEHRAVVKRVENYNRENVSLTRKATSSSEAARTASAAFKAAEEKSEELDARVKYRVEGLSKAGNASTNMEREEKRFRANYGVNKACRRVSELSDQLRQTNDRIISSGVYRNKRNGFFSRVFNIISWIHKKITMKGGVYDRVMDDAIPQDQLINLSSLSIAVQNFEGINKGIIDSDRQLADTQVATTDTLILKVESCNTALELTRGNIDDSYREVLAQEGLLEGHEPPIEPTGRPIVRPLR